MQAQNTPFVLEPLVTIFSETGQGSHSFKQVLDVTFTSPMACDPFVVTLLQHLYHPLQIREIHTLTRQDGAKPMKLSHCHPPEYILAIILLVLKTQIS